MNLPINPSLSVDCVVFGFDGRSLKVLLIERRHRLPDGQSEQDFKLPGSLIYESENVDQAAHRVLEQYTGRRETYLRQLHVFSDPDRIKGEELAWLQAHYRVETMRVVTVAYYMLVKLDDALLSQVRIHGARWIELEKIHQLAMDHKQILAYALDTLSKQLMAEPIAFELLPRKFTLRQLQDLYEGILGIEIDNRNFRKKVLSSDYIVPTGEREKQVAHKPALYYTFNRQKFRKDTRLKFRLNFINWQL